jgi:hypothetical protein
MLQQYKAQPIKKRLSNKIIAGLAAFITTGVITVSGFAAATPMNKPKTNDDCKKANLSAQEQKECEKEVAASVQAQQTVHNGQANHLGGHGYGGVSVGTNINLNLNNSNNNVIQVIVNIFRN